MKTKTNINWVIKIVAISVVTSMTFTFASNEILGRMGYVMAFLVLFIFIVLGILFDIIGIAVTASDEVPFHSMAAHRERGAVEALRLIKNADKVSSVCNDVVGDVSGIVSGGVAALIAARLTTGVGTAGDVITPLAISGAVTGLMIGGKAVGKTLAINSGTDIILKTGKLLNLLKRLTGKK